MGNAVSLGKLTKRLRRDLAANPKKGLLLGVMILVAGYFWAPLVLKAFGAKGHSPAALAPATVSSASNSSGPVAGGQPMAAFVAAPGLRWEDLQQAIQADGCMASARLDPAWRNPFAARPGQATRDKQAAASEPEPAPAVAAKPAVPDLSPADAGLVLQSLAVGSRQRLSTISGQVYREGETVPAANGAGEFQLTKITPLGIELTQNGRPHWLEIARPQLAHGDKFDSRGRARSNNSENDE